MLINMGRLLSSVFLLFSVCFCFSQTITNAEYFFNTDPGVGNGTALVINSNTGQLTQTFSIPTTGLSDGFHSLYVRTYNSDNNWSLYDRKSFYLKSFLTSNITAAEYFFNTDPGVGNGIALTVNSNTGQLTQTFTIPTNALSEGFHNLYIRTLNTDNSWSLYDREVFYVKHFDAYTITAAEYFFNTDPGIGNGTSLSVDTNSGTLTQTFSIATTGLPEGFHNFYLRTQDSSGNWSLYDRQVIYIKDFDVSPDEISAAEYFIDTDPGVGNGTSVVFSNPSLSTQTLNIDSSGLAEGDHIFYIRVQDTNGDWSIYDSASFNIDASLSTESSLFRLTKLYPNPFSDRLVINTPNNIKITKTEIYDAIGKTVYSNTGHKNILDLTSLNQGIYILNIKTDTGSASFKIVKN